MGLAVTVGPGADVLYEVLHRYADGEQVDRDDLLRFGRVGGDVLFAGGHEEVELFFVVGLGPENGVFFLQFFVGNESDVEALDLGHRVSLDLIDGAGQFEGDAGCEDGAHGFAKAFAQSLFTNINEHDAVAGGQDADPNEGEVAELFFQEAVEPAVADLETKLVVEGLGGGGEQSSRLAEQTHQTAFVDEPDFFALDAGTVGFEDERQQGFETHQGQDGGENPGDLAVVLREAKPLEGFAGGREEGQQGTQHQCRATRAEEPDAFELGESAGVFAQEKGHQAEAGEHSHGQCRGGRCGGAHVLEVFEEVECPTDLHEEEHQGQARYEPFFEEDAGFAGREGFVDRRVKECRFAAGSGQFVHLESLGLFGGLQAHLEPGHQGSDQPDQGEGGSEFSGRGIGDLGHHFEADGQSQQGNPVQHSGFESVSFHGRSGG